VIFLPILLENRAKSAIYGRAKIRRIRAVLNRNEPLG